MLTINFQLDEMDAYRLVEFLKNAKLPFASRSVSLELNNIREIIEMQLKNGLMDSLILADPYFDATTSLFPEEPLQVNF